MIVEVDPSFGLFHRQLENQPVVLGADAGQFGLALPDISSPADLSSNESLDFTISLNPTGSSGLRNAVVLITSNDPDTPVFAFNVTGLALSRSADGDSDGMTDGGEYSMRGFGFDWEVSQPSRVSDYYALAHTTGLHTPAEAAGAAGTMTVLNVNPVSNTVDLTIGLEQSLDLDTFTPKNDPRSDLTCCRAFAGSDGCHHDPV